MAGAKHCNFVAHVQQNAGVDRQELTDLQALRIPGELGFEPRLTDPESVEECSLTIAASRQFARNTSDNSLFWKDAFAGVGRA